MNESNNDDETDDENTFNKESWHDLFQVMTHHSTREMSFINEIIRMSFGADDDGILDDVYDNLLSFFFDWFSR